MNRPEKQTSYRGFTTTTNRNIRKLYDIDLIKQDLMNHFNTKKTERFRNSVYGSIIPDMLFEPMTDQNVNIIVQDVLRIIKTEPRVSLVNYVVNVDTYAVTMAVELFYVGLEVQDVFPLIFNYEQKLISTN